MISNKLILIVDDDLPLLENTAYMIETLGYEVITARDGIEAVDVYKSARPLLTFMDIKMPKQDGFDAFFKIKEFDSDAKVILITAYNVDEKKHLKAKSMSLLETIGKPYDIEKLEDTINKYLNS
ncbi:MAG: response regulator [Nitrosarchaeum sp.]|nr:response regulator [Nitrosarchaeum sp.]MCV0400059.1 response regulator [Nitrosarchaeum sp.]